MNNLIQTMLPYIEEELHRQVTRLDEPRTRAFYDMLTYQMGWTGEGAGPDATGKRVRPLLLLLTTAACGEEWLHAISAAASVELVHNFSLVHDDIQDKSALRRGRATVWKVWGEPMAINAGDALFVLSNQSILDLSEYYPATTVTRAALTLNDTCLTLTSGQFLDMLYEKQVDLGIDDYWPMIAGKTASLLSACCHIGAILGKADESVIDAYRSFGHALGLAFQVQDDLLGIWGDEARTGKSTASDLVDGKKTLPVIFGLNANGEFAERWKRGSIQVHEVEKLAQVLASDGAYEHTHDMVRQLTTLALNSLREAEPQGEAGEAIEAMANKLISRDQ